MRYFNSENVAFSSADGKTVSVKETLPMVGKSDLSFEVECSANTSLDEIATRPSAYGEGSEASAYRVFEENVVEIFEAGLDLGKIKKLRVPL